MPTLEASHEIIIAIIAGVFGGGLVFAVNWYKAKRAADTADKAVEEKHEIDSGKLALEFIGELRGRIDQLNTRISCLENELQTQREASRMKDDRIAELERKTTEQEAEILELRKKIADKDEIIKRLNARIAAIEQKQRGE